MLQNFGKYILKRRLKKLSRKVVTHNLNSAKTALILYHANDPINQDIVKHFARSLKEELIQVHTLGYISNLGKKQALPEENQGYEFFNQMMLSRLRIPEPTFIKKHIAKNYHLLIDLNVEGHFPLQYISSLSKAEFKVGKSGDYRDEVCDLTLDLQTKNIEELTKQIITYLEMINRK